MEAKNMNMRPMPKKDNSNGLIGGALGAAIGTALGATFGVGGAYAYNRLTEDNIVEPPIDPELMEVNDDVEVVEAEPEHHHVHHIHQIDNVYVVNDGNDNNDNDNDDILTPPDEPMYEDVFPGSNFDEDEPYVADVSDNDDSSIQIVSYERITMDDGSQMDVANIIYQGHHAAIIDVDLDGWADALQLDEDGNNVISEDEFHPLEADMRIEMAPLAQAANYQPEDEEEFGNDLPTAFVGTEPDFDTPPEIEDENVIASTDPENDEEIGFDTYGETGNIDSDDYLANNDSTISDGTDDLVLV